MNYKYQRNQIFGKRLKVPKPILNRVYNCTLSFSEYIEYQLEGKIPVSCIAETDREIVEKFGIDKCKELDWELINKRIYSADINIKEILMSVDPRTENINLALYEIIKDKLRPSDYSPKMAETYSKRLFEIPQIDYEKYDYNEIEIRNRKNDFNNGLTSLEEIINNWDLFKDKDLNYCLLNDKKNTNHISDKDIKTFMAKYGILIPIITANYDIYEFINQLSTLSSEEEKKAYLKQFTDTILSNTYRKSGDGRPAIKLTDEQYKEIFKYSSLEEYLKIFYYGYSPESLIKELNNLPEDYLFNIPIPFSQLLNSSVLTFIETYGLKNIVDFDNECGHFFTKNNCEMLKLMNNMYLHYSGNEHDPNKTIHTKKTTDENGNYIDRPYTKDEFYEAMKRMIIYGPSDWNYEDKAPNYRTMTGEFRTRNKDLFISESAPEELQKLFYTKSITPKLILEHPEYIPYLEGKELSSCFKNIEAQVEDNNKLYNYENIYKFISSKTDFKGTMNFITEYGDVLDIVFDRKKPYIFQYEPKFTINNDISQIQDIIHEALRKLIIEKESAYPAHVPKDFIKNYPTMFLDKKAPKELQEAFYSRTISAEFILSNPSYKEYLKGVDLEVLFRYMPVNVTDEKQQLKQINLVNGIKQIFGSDEAMDIMILYGKYLEKAFENNGLQNFKFEPDFSKDDFLNEIDKIVLQQIIDGKVKYNENIASHFKNNNPTLFLGQNVPQEIKDKFYNRQFTIKDFNDNPNLFEIFGTTNIACGFSESLAWIIPLFNDSDNFKTANYNRMKVILAYSKIQDIELKNAFKEYFIESSADIDLEKVEYVSEVLSRLSLSNSIEIFTFRKELASQILKSNNPLESLNKIEDIFIRNNIPTVGKIYSCFDVLHPNFQGFNFEHSNISPVLKKASTTSKKIIVFSDLIKASFGSNNRSVNSYLKNIELGFKLYESIKTGQIQFDELSETEKKELTTFSKHLATLYNNTTKARKENETFTTSGDTLKDILELSKKLSPNGTLNYNLADRVIQMFCGFTGINTLKQAKEYIEQKIKRADSRNRNTSNSDVTLSEGDFIKGIGDIKYLRNILQNGSVSKEYLGSSAGSDATPLDTDVSMIIDSEGTINDKINKTAAKNYGPIWFVLKNDERFMITRNSSNETLKTKKDLSKLEVFYTGVLGSGHYGIRTGFASSDINYIIMENYDPRVGLEIAMNGFYIPIANKDGKIIFTPEDYDKLREKMSGLSYFEEQTYSFSENLVTEETQLIAEQIEESNREVLVKREKINNIIKKSLEELGLQLKTNIDGDLTAGYVELIDTGSTGRGTNKPGDGDFDFMMRLDKTILSNPSRLNEVKQTILKNLGRENSFELTGAGDFRLKNIDIDNDTKVDIDITFTEKTDKVLYSTDMALQDRLTTIQNTDKEKYKYVIANILLAKQVLKKAEAYKPNRGETPQGGLGGVGIENWILQNGGSFIDAAKSFIDAAENKSFSEFKDTYRIWDFGDNHLAERRGQYAHDNFVANNMSETGYHIMVETLKEYLKTIEIYQDEKESKKRRL